MKKKLVAIISVVAMLVTMIPTSAFAITVDGGVKTEQELIDAISDGGEVKLGADITLSEQSQQFKISGNSVTIDLNGFNLTRGGTSSKDLFYINNNGFLTINDSKGEGTITSSYPIQMMSNSKFILNGGNIVSPKGAAVDIYNDASNVLMEMNGGSVKGAADNTFGIRGSSNVKVNVNDGLISAVPGNRLAMYVSGDNDNAIEINVTGGRIEAEGQAVQAYSGATINVSGEAEIYSQTNVAISTQSGYGVVELNVNGGEIKTGSATSYAIQAREKSVVNVEDGTISGGYAIKVSDKANINVSGGEIKSAANKDAISVNKGSDATVILTGGTFSGKLDGIADYVPDGYKLTNGTVEPTPANDPDVVAVTGGIYYKDLANAISMVDKGGTVELLADIEATDTIEVPSGKNFTLDLGKYNISKGETFAGTRLINVTDSKVSLRGEGQILAGNVNGVTVRGGELDIAGSVTIETDPAAVRQTVQAYGAKLTIGGNAYIEGYYAVTVYNSDFNKKGSISSELIVNGGTINGVPAGIAGNNLESAGSKITVTGGTVQADKEGIAMYLPMESTVEVSGDAQITGGTAIEAKMGTITFYDNAVIRGTGAWNENEPENGGSSPEGSAFLGSAQMYGANGPGSTNPQYMTSPDLTVNFLGGTFISDNGNAITIYNTEKIDKQDVVVNVQNGDFQAAEGKGAIRYVTVSDEDNETVYNSEDGTYTATKDKTTVNVSADAAAAAVNTDGKTTYYTTVDEALAANSETAAEPVEIFVMADSEMAPEGLAHENIKITTAPGVELEVFSDVSDMIVEATKNADGTTTYKLVAEGDFVIDGSDLKVSADKTTVHEGEKATIKAEVTAELTGAKFVYTWYKDGKAIEGASGATFEATESGEYYVSVKAVKTEGGATLTSAAVNGPVLKITVEPHDFSGGGTVTPSVTKSRVAGDDRFETAIKVADKLKSELGVVKFNNIVVANSDEFADALSATALAADKDAPILVVNKNNESTVKTYIANNLNKGGNVYIIGGTSVVSESFEKSLTGCKVTRLGGADRYETNLAVLRAIGVTGASDIMVASGLKYPDALSASATGNPVLLVGKTLTDNQKAYLATLGGNDDYYVIGGTAAVNATVMNQLNASKLGTVTRLGGDTRYETGLAVADEFFTNARNVVIASGDDFPDGLTGGVLANAMNAPLMLVNQYNTDVAADYVDDNSVRSVVAIGGTAAISNAVLNAVA